MKTKSIDINSPEVLLNSWIDMNVRVWFDRGFKNRFKIGKILLAHIFYFAEEHGKLKEVFEWLKSEHAKSVLRADGDDQGGVWVLEAFESLASLNNTKDSGALESKLMSFADKNFEITKYELKLGEPVYVRS